MNNVFYETINPKTAKGGSMIWSSNQYHGRTLYDCYNKPSTTKENIWDFWVNECRRLNPKESMDATLHNIHVVSYNCMMFTIGFEDDENWYYITPTHNYKIPKNV